MKYDTASILSTLLKNGTKQSLRSFLSIAKSKVYHHASACISSNHTVYLKENTKQEKCEELGKLIKVSKNKITGKFELDIFKDPVRVIGQSIMDFN